MHCVLSNSTCSQLLTGEAWHEVMLAAVDATNSLSASVYFSSHHFVILLLFLPLFVGTLCAAVAC